MLNYIDRLFLYLLKRLKSHLRARGSVVGWGTMLQAGRSRIRFPIRSLGFSFGRIIPAALWLWGSTPPLTEVSTRNLPGGGGGGGKGRPARKADS
jgi:hypothetical protein